MNSAYSSVTGVTWLARIEHSSSTAFTSSGVSAWQEDTIHLINLTHFTHDWYNPCLVIIHRVSNIISFFKYPPFTLQGNKHTLNWWDLVIGKLKFHFSHTIYTLDHETNISQSGHLYFHEIDKTAFANIEVGLYFHECIQNSWIFCPLNIRVVWCSTPSSKIISSKEFYLYYKNDDNP